MLRPAAAADCPIAAACASTKEVGSVKSRASVVVALPLSYKRREAEGVGAFRQRMGGRLRLETPGGHQVAICPATYANTNRSRRLACARPRAGGTIIGFPARGLQRKSLEARIGEFNGQ